MDKSIKEPATYTDDYTIIPYPTNEHSSSRKLKKIWDKLPLVNRPRGGRRTHISRD